MHLNSEMEENTGVSFDILEWFPISFCENVFKHLSGKEVLEASVVNKEWCKFAAEKKQMKKVKLVVHNGNTSEILRNSTRHYLNVEFRNVGPFSVAIPSWPDQQKCNEILEMIDPFVEELWFSLEGWTDSANFRWTFPRLKSLNFNGRKSNLLKTFGQCRNLEKFKWSTAELERDNHEIATFLMYNKNLKELGGPIYSLAEYPFELKLQKLAIEHLRSSPETARSMEKLCMFLESQAQSLESIEIRAKIDQACLELILTRMPRLSSLTVVFSQIREAVSGLKLAFPINTSVTSLYLSYGDPILSILLNQPRYTQQTLIDTLIRGLTSLKHLKYPKISDFDLLFLSQEVTGLESIETKEFNVLRLPRENIFPNMKRFKADSFNEDIEVPSSETNFAALVSTELMKYFQRKYMIE